MRTNFLIIGLLCLSYVQASKTAGGANNDPLILYAIAMLILGGLLGFPYLLNYIKNRISNYNKSKDTSEESDISND